MEYLISMYIDNELNIDEKKDFVEHIHESKEYKDTAVSLLEQEKFLQAAVIAKVPEISIPKTRRFAFTPLWANSVGLAVAASLLIVLAFLAKDYQHPNSVVDIRQETETTTHRFVIYHAGINRAEITGSFTNWQRVPMQPAGSTGYWETTLELPVGEHRFVYILDDNKLFADPTVLAQETDDYGTTNSILSIGRYDYEI
jgi:hypothetical protein